MTTGRHSHRSRRSRRSLAAPATAMAMATAVVIAAVTGCGLAPEKRPRPILDRAITDLVAPAPKTATPSSGGAELQASLYFVRGERLEQITVPAGNGQVTRERAITLLLNGPPRDRKGLTSSIPPGTTLRRATRTGSTLRIDLSGEIKSIGAGTATAAYAQLVFTALDLPGVQSVRFAIEGDDIDAPTDDGSLKVIRARNYKSPLNPRR